MVLGLSLSVARTSTTSPAFVPTRIFSPCQHTLRTDRPSGRSERRNISWLTSFWTNAMTQGQNSYPFPSTLLLATHFWSSKEILNWMIEFAVETPPVQLDQQSAGPACGGHGLKFRQDHQLSEVILAVLMKYPIHPNAYSKVPVWCGASAVIRLLLLLWMLSYGELFGVSSQKTWTVYMSNM